MEWSVKEVGGVKVIAIGEALEGEFLSSLVELVAKLLSEPRLRLVLQLARCPYVSSEALRFFLQIARRVERQGGRFALAAPKGDVDRALRVSGVSRLVKVVPSPEELAQETKASEQLARLAESVLELLARGDGRQPD